MKNRYQFNLFVYYDFYAITIHLSKMARKGWMLKTITPFFWKYKRIAPQAIPFTVTYLDAASKYDSEPPIEQQEFEAFCSGAGWKFIAQWEQMLIFAGDTERPTPMDTDPAVTLENIHTIMNQSFLPRMQFSLFGVFLLISTWFFPIRIQSISILSSYLAIFAFLSLALSILLQSIDLGQYYLWYRKAKKSARNSMQLPPAYTKWRLPVLLAIALTAACTITQLFLNGQIVFASFIILMAVCVNSWTYLFRKRKVSREQNRTYTMFASFVTVLLFQLIGPYILMQTDSVIVRKQDFNPPLTAESLGLSSLIRKSSDEQATFFLSYSHFFFNEPESDRSLSYTIVDAYVSFLDFNILNELKCTYYYCRYEEINPAPWQADRVLRDQDEYIVVWKNRYLKISFPEAPTSEQITYITKILSR